MNDTTKKWALLVIRGLLTLAFAAAGIAKLMGVPMMVATFDAVGLGQWFRYVTGIIELGSAILLWMPGYAAHAAGLLVCTMIGALIAHAAFLGMDTAAPAAVLGVLAAVTLYANRTQLQR
jgi:putative oxidoreductase